MLEIFFNTLTKFEETNLNLYVDQNTSKLVLSGDFTDSDLKDKMT